MADTIKIGNLDISAFKVGGADCSIYLGTVKLYPQGEPVYSGFCRLTLNDDSVVEIQGSGELTQAMITSYQSTVIGAEIGTLCTSIGASAFRECTNLASVTISDTVTSIGQYAFRQTSLTEVIIPDSVSGALRNYQFYLCTKLRNVTIGSGITGIGSDTFGQCRVSGTVTIKSNAITSASYTSSSNLSDRFTDKPTKYIFSDEVTTIASSLLYGGSAVTDIEIGSGITSIGASAFRNCSSLTTLTLRATTPPSLATGVFLGTDITTIYVPADSVEAYKAKSNWNTFASRIQAIPA